jgi:hypothetical protein
VVSLAFDRVFDALFELVIVVLFLVVLVSSQTFLLFVFFEYRQWFLGRI